MTHVDGDDYTYPDIYHQTEQRDVRTLDAKQDERIVELERRVDALFALVSGAGVSFSRTPHILSSGRAAVLITRHDAEVTARHVVVHHQRLLDDTEGLSALQSQGWVFVLPTAAGAILDALTAQA
ncbi:MAG: hypothetical protein IPM06_19980 [Rhizobiales bacterium]|nr:hypothetical protein [Hyphomicrobiales bacterium]